MAPDGNPRIGQVVRGSNKRLSGSVILYTPVFNAAEGKNIFPCVFGGFKPMINTSDFSYDQVDYNPWLSVKRKGNEFIYNSWVADDLFDYPIIHSNLEDCFEVTFLKNKTVIDQFVFDNSFNELKPFYKLMAKIFRVYADLFIENNNDLSQTGFYEKSYLLGRPNSNINWSDFPFKI